MPGYLIELRGEAREVYYVEAESEDVARDTWSSGSLEVSEASGMGIYDVREEEL